MDKVVASAVSRKLNNALTKIDRPGTFCASGSADAVMPGLKVDDVGMIGLPVAAAQLKVLKQCCEQAPYGKGTQTLVDTDVRRVWRLTPDRFALTNPAWTKFVDKAVEKVQADLGLEDQKLEAHLYDLLLYEAGGFFLPHRDGEKLDRMVATLVVILPSSYEGGELIVRHEGEAQTIDFSGPASQFQIHFAAFYADCEHEVKPLRSGHRLCLVYSLTLAKSKSSIGAPRMGEHVAAVTKILREWANAMDDPLKLAVTLEHQYTQEGMSWDSLKGLDRAKALVLAEAASQAGCQAHLALLTLWESGSAEGAGCGWHDRRYGRYGDDEESESHEMGEIFDTSLSAENWRSPTGDAPPFGKIPVEREEIVPPESLTEVDPEEDFEGYTGNAGMTLERWYRHAAIVLWPDTRHLDLLCFVGSRDALPALARMVSAWQSADESKADVLRTQCLEFAGKILAKWPEAHYRNSRYAHDDSNAPDPMASLARLDEPRLIAVYLRDTLVKDASLSPGKTTAKAIIRHGWATFRRELVILFQATNRVVIERNATLLEQLSLAMMAHAGKKGAEPAAKETCRLLAEILVAALVMIDGTKAENDWRSAEINRPVLLATMARALLACEADDLLSTLVGHVQTLVATYGLREAELPALVQLAPWLKEDLKRAPAALSNWISSCEKQLESLTAAAPQPPADLRREADVKCKCADCAELKRFLLDPRESEHGFKMAQDRRSHLESVISQHKCDLTCKTVKGTSPQILHCTKTAASHERRLKQYHEDLKNLAALRSLEKSLACCD